MFFPNHHSAVHTVVRLVLSSVFVFSMSTNAHGDEESPKLIIVSFDGFRWDYLSRTHTPNFDRIIRKGVHARYGIQSSFITVTLPNQYTLVTGLYAESHGIVANIMFDPELKEEFSVYNKSQIEASRWFDVGAEPIWVTNQVQNKQGRSGCMQWVGCEARVKGVTPSWHVPYTADMKSETRIDKTLEWFTGQFPVNLGLLYFQEPDETAHQVGPDSPQVTDMIGELDKAVGYLLDRLEQEGMLQHTNLIITSDHGFAATSHDRIVKLDDYIQPGTYRTFSKPPVTVAAILPNEVQTVVGFILSSVLVFSTSTNAHGDGDSPKLIIVSFDGFRWDYLSRTLTPNFDRIIRKGVHARYGIQSSFITKTLPNHYTLVTGLYEESHGIVANSMFDPELNEKFNVLNKSQVEASRWFDVGAEPIWVTNQVQNKQGRSGCMQWVGCEARVKGVIPSRHVPYTANMKNETRIDKTLDWFMGSFPVNLGLIYFQEPDHTAHQVGPDSPQVTDLIGELDKVVGYLLDRLEQEGMLQHTNLIITSDHGFEATSHDRIINLDNYINPGTYRIFSSTPVAAILPNEGMEDEIYDKLLAGAKTNPNFKVYKKGALPEELHYTHNRRIMPILVLASDNYTIIFNNSTYVAAGNHGYNNSHQNMHPFFVAMGPGFREGVDIPTFENVDVYPLMCHLLGLQPAPNNGSLDRVKTLLREDDEKTTMVTFATYFFVLLVIGSVGGVFGVATCRQHRYLKRMHRVRAVQMEAGAMFSIPPANGGAKIPLLSDTSDEESFH